MDYIEIQNIIYDQNLSVAIREAFPVIHGVRNSWADIMDFVDSYEIKDTKPLYNVITTSPAA